MQKINVFLNMFGVTISCDLKLPVCKNYMNFADKVGIYKYQHIGAKTLEIQPILSRFIAKIRSFNGPINSVKQRQKHALFVTSQK